MVIIATVINACMKTIKIGWCLDRDEGSAVYYDPQPTSSLTERSTKDAGVGSCPAVRDFENQTFTVRSPFTFRLRAIPDGDEISFHPVYPFTQIEEHVIQNLLLFQPKRLWRNPKYPVLQLNLPYVFVADENVLVNQIEPTKVLGFKNWSLIQGRFDIYAWQRPLNWAIEWTNIKEDLIVRRGQPLFQLMFQANEVNTNFTMGQIERTVEIERAITATKNVTSVMKGTKKIIQEQAQKDREPLL